MFAWRILRLPASARPSSSLARRTFPPGARLSELTDFRNLRAPDVIYIDKSKYIETFLRYRGALHLIKRPRRCGKTTLLSMFKDFFALEPSTRDERAAMFSGLDIKEKYPLSWHSHFGKYPVFHFDFKNLIIADHESFRSSLASEVRDAADEFSRLGYFKNLTSRKDGVDLQRLLNMESDGPDLLKSLWRICRLATRSTGIPPVVLIDEYDSPIMHAAENAAQTGNMDDQFNITADMISMLARLFKSSPQVLSRALLVGVSQMAESGYLSRLNNIQIFGVTDTEYAEACHFTATDVEDLFNHYTTSIYDSPVPFDLAQLQERYNGYRTPPPSSTPLCIPFAVTSALNRGQIKPFWTISGGDKLLRNMLLQVSKTEPILENFTQLLANETITFKYRPAIDYGNPATADEFWSIMLDSGYIAPADEPNAFKIPNPDVSEALFRTHSPEEAHQLAIALLEGNVRDIYSVFSGFLLRINSHLTSSDKEYAYHCYAAGILMSVPEITCRVNQVAGHGRLDVVNADKDSKRASIIEFKGTKIVDSLPAEVRVGSDQIQARQYAFWLPASVKRVTEVGIACHHQHAAVGCRVRTRTGISGPSAGWIYEDDNVQIMTAGLYDQDTLRPE
ncbi:hypothetical protein GGX14DRAFT_612897 [Mycena pura]|uniref:AAA-ATPase-like domain-containing protein n=1 Tax=Mycena pura TaxID=153505 RepID=A0AAD7E4J4_9AGAR|nr:hypothetical protein GGX14DRAFT_612897 [Mycena pura]